MFLGIDLGTSSLKALVLDVDGSIVGTGSASYPLTTPQPGWAESDPEDWWQAAATAGQPACDRDGRPDPAVAARQRTAGLPAGALGAAAKGLVAITHDPRGGNRAERCLRHAALRPDHGLLGQGRHR